MCRMPLWALSEAEQQGYAIDKKYLAETTESLLGEQGQVAGLEDLSQSGGSTRPAPPGSGLNMGLPFLAVAARSLPSLTEGKSKA